MIKPVFEQSGVESYIKFGDYIKFGYDFATGLFFFTDGAVKKTFIEKIQDDLPSELILIEKDYSILTEDNIGNLVSGALLANALKITYNAHLVDESDMLATSIALANDIKAKMNLHYADQGTGGLDSGIALANALKDTVNVHYADQGTGGLDSAKILANSIKNTLNLHYIDVGTAGLASAQALANDIKAKMNLHYADAGDGGLDSAILLANALKATINTHYADQGVGGEEHIAADGALVAAEADDLAKLITLTVEIQDSYITHDLDAALADTWVYHQAQGTAYVLTDEVAPDELTGCVAILNDIKAKVNLHMADAVSHAEGDSTSESQADGAYVEEHHTAHSAIATDDGSDLATTITLTVALQDSYALHDADVELAEDWAYHNAAEAADVSLASEVNPDTLVGSILVLNDIKAKLNIHMVDGTAHTNGDSTVISTADAEKDGEHILVYASIVSDDADDLATLITLSTEMQDSYVAHEGDSEQGAGWTYHSDEEAADVSLVSEVNPDDLQGCVIVLNDLKTQLNLHMADVAVHGSGDSELETANAAAYVEEHISAHSVIATADADDLSSLITLTSAIQDSYALHDVDTELADSWVYHNAQEDADVSLTSEVNPTTRAVAIAVLNDIKAKLNTHMADAVTHTNGDSVIESVADAAEVEEHIAEFTTIATASASDLTTLLALVSAMQDSYVLHEGDSELADTWVYHIAQEAGDVSLADPTNPTTLLEAVADLNDFKTQLNSHMSDSTAHIAGDSAAVAAAAVTNTSEHIDEDTLITTENAISTDAGVTIIALTNALLAAYALHDDDAVLAADWVYHQAQGGGDALASEVAATTLGEAITKLNDIKAKFNLHVADSVAHTDGDSTLEVVADAAATVYIQYFNSNILSSHDIIWSSEAAELGVEAVIAAGKVTFEFAGIVTAGQISFTIFRPNN